MITGVGSVFVRGGLRWWIARQAASALYRRALAQATHVIFHNPDDRADFARWGLLTPGVPVTVTAGSGVALGHHAAQTPNPAGGLLFASRFMTDKGFDEFLQAGNDITQIVETGLIPVQTGVDNGNRWCRRRYERALSGCEVASEAKRGR
jgi:hypothetical protein